MRFACKDIVRCVFSCSSFRRCAETHLRYMKEKLSYDLNWNADGASSRLPEAHLLFINSTVATHQLDCFPDLMYYHEM